MGNCLVSIRVTGCHHNGIATDIDQMAADFVAKLKGANHNVTGAVLLSGGEQDLLDPSRRFPIKS
jgi:hypothetical protein